MTFQAVGFFFHVRIIDSLHEVKQTVSRKEELTPLSGYVAPSLPLTLWPS